MKVVQGFAFGFVFTFSMAVLFFSKDMTLGLSSNDKIEECQQSLPRDVNCVIIAVPENEIGELE